ncbi:hypothetical protein C4J81_01740 [Deltaproteobacteria bacterium Smac51]|nr:hypothetical protein C4J81_01740 [Deltaproteobacteria bacterium Smac51]
MTSKLGFSETFKRIYKDPAEPEYTVIANATVQFIDYELDLSLPVEDWRTTGVSRPLAELAKPFQQHQRPDKQLELITLHPDQGDTPPKSLSSSSFECVFKVSYLKAFQILANQWLPMPFLAMNCQYEDGTLGLGLGPTDWCRGFITPLEGGKFRLTLAFDSSVKNDGSDDARNDVPDEDEDSAPAKSSAPYPALQPQNVDHRMMFALATHRDELDWFLGLPWVGKFLDSSCEAFKNHHPDQRMVEVVTPSGLDCADPRLAWEALFRTLMEGLEITGQVGLVQAVTLNSADSPIDVHLVLDLGSNRLTGLLVEDKPPSQIGEGIRLTDCYPLQIRDLSSPGHVYDEPMDSRIEFTIPSIGPLNWSRMARGAGESFIWPSPVRVGPEANRLAASSREENGPTGLSSPKRYLYDTRLRDEMQWYFNDSRPDSPGGGDLAASGYTPFLTRVNEAGFPVSALEDENLPRAMKEHVHDKSGTGGFRACYSLSSTMMFLLSEVISHALSTINSPVVREKRGVHPKVPRRLKSILLTVPTAMSVTEQNIYRTWARLAVQTVWEVLGWTDYYNVTDPSVIDFRLNPVVRADWDEATCTQMFWIFNELCNKFHGKAADFFKIMGRIRTIQTGPDKGDSVTCPTLRIASIDVGGATSDFSIITYAINERAQAGTHVKPYKTFRDGFKVAGDDVVRSIIKSFLLESLAERGALDEAGADVLRGKLSRLFEHHESDQAEVRAWRIQFIKKLAIPLAMRILNLYESVGLPIIDRDRKEPTAEEIQANPWLSKNYNEDNLPPLTLKIGEVLKKTPELEHTAAYLENIIRENGRSEFAFFDHEIQLEFSAVDNCVRTVMEKIILDMGEVIKLYDCDVLILTGRPSVWPALMRMPYAGMFVEPDRVVHIHHYKAGEKYPFLDENGFVLDPKVTVVIGAVIAAMADGRLVGINIDTSNLIPSPTLRYIGMLEGDGQLKNGSVWWSPGRADWAERPESSTSWHSEEIDLGFSAPVNIGARQLSDDRWPTARLYRLGFSSEDAVTRARGKLPYLINLAFDEAEPQEAKADEESVYEFYARNRPEEPWIVINSVRDNAGRELRPEYKNDLLVQLHTLRYSGGYWVDTGILSDI